MLLEHELAVSQLAAKKPKTWTPSTPPPLEEPPTSPPDIQHHQYRQKDQGVPLDDNFVAMFLSGKMCLRGVRGSF